jgi:hypothetical protein
MEAGRRNNTIVMMIRVFITFALYLVIAQKPVQKTDPGISQTIPCKEEIYLYL